MINPRQHFTTYIPTAATALLFIASAALSCWAVSLSIVKLPAEDVWQHIDLISSASNGHLNIDALWKKHNHIHFIPLPKLIYALDILWFKGSGIFTVSVSMTATVLTCFLFARIVLRETPQLIFPYRHSIALLTASWLICILQWESFVNPADLQWAGLSLGLLLLANGLPKQIPWIFTGCVVSIGSGVPWWLLLVVLLLFALLYKGYKPVVFLCLLAAVVIFWEIANSGWLHQFVPLPLRAIQIGIPNADPTTAQITAFEAHWAFFGNWIYNMASFIAKFCLPPLSLVLPNSWLTALGILPISLMLLALRPYKQTSTIFLVLITFFLSVAAAAVRAPWPNAYTERFVSTGLLFVCGSLLLVLLHCRNTTHVRLWWCIAAMYSLLLAINSWQEAANIVSKSNQRRLSQVAYALDIRDMRASAELPFLPTIALSYQQISERKSVLAENHVGIYNSREHRVFAGVDQLPSQEYACIYKDLVSKPLRDDPTARKIIGTTLDAKENSLTSLLILNSHGHAIGYGIRRTLGNNVIQQLSDKAQWAGFLHRPAEGRVTLIAYNSYQRCQPYNITLP